MIEIKNVSKSYIKGAKIIDNLNLEIKDGEILGFTIYNTSYISEKAEKSPRFGITNGHYYALDVHVNLPLGVGPQYQCVKFKKYFNMFYRGYKPKDKRAHIILFTPEHPNDLYFEVSKPDYMLYVNRLVDLFMAVCVGYEYTEKYYDGGDDEYPRRIYKCQIDNTIELKLTETNITYLNVVLL